MTSSPELLLALSGDDSAGVKLDVAKNASAPPDAMVALSTYIDPVVRRAVADNRNTPSATLSELAADEDSATYGRAVVEQRARIATRFDISAENAAAIEAIAELDWWDLESSDPQIAIVRAVHHDL